MVKKLQKMAAKKQAAAQNGFALPAGLGDGALAQMVKDSAQQIWAAGLGAFAKAQGEGSKVFETLVSEGMKLQKKTQAAAEEKLGAVANKMSDMAGEVGSRAGQHWDKLESIFEERVQRALGRLGVPSAKEIESLIARIDALSAAVGLPAVKPARRKAPAKSAAATKSVAKKAPAKPQAKAAAAAKPIAKKAAPVAKKAAPRKPAARKSAAATAASAA
ncbi:phasin family protein [Pelomonas sp. CA6]|uniref:phasin family protein n=1 Tax=Pelomonas sp. CA6 TaxID=2907999 RepID=UPI001F4A15CE|nr:phasin family protein [Pelomonas sp. CA6]MCH7341896.1 phasin family protein [Pelomonas sp. CA6]